MSEFRKIKKVIKGRMTRDGAGVKLKRIFGFHEEGLLDPFLLLDHFGSDDPNDFLAGFPWHPHRGMETVTYILDGRVEHQDSMGNKGVIGKGDVQWMNAGSGIIHQEMPKSDGEKMYGFQLWANLPASQKMMKPGYQEITANTIPEINIENNIRIKVIAGEFQGIRGPVKDVVADPVYFDITVPEKSEFTIDVNADYTVFAYVFEGEGFFDDQTKTPLKTGEGALLDDGSKIKIQTEGSSVRFILIAGKPLNEPIAWQGPIVMNTQEELETAFKEYQNGTFIK
jgi:quercetin 2,3-dioxygenase